MATLSPTGAGSQRSADARPTAATWQAAATWAWAAVLALAVATRLVALSATELAPVEAVRAMASLEATLGQGWQGSPESPLLLVGNALLFTLFGPGNGVARALPALAGIAVVALPLLWRKQLGEIGALSAACLLVISPLTLFAARRVGYAPLGSLGAAMLVTLLMHSRRRDRADAHQWQRWILAVGTTLGLIGGPTFLDLFLPGALAWFLVQGRGRRPNEMPWRAILVGAIAALLISVAFGMRWDGWAGLTDGAAAWLGMWRDDVRARISTPGLMTLYEPLLLAMGLAGAALLWAVPAERAPDDDVGGSLRQVITSLTLWGLLAFALHALRPGSTAESLSATLIPLSLLGGYGAQRLVDGVRAESRHWVGLHVLAGFLLWLPGLQALAQHASGLAATNQVMLVIVGAAILIALQVLLALLFSLLITPGEVWRSSFLGGAAILLLLQASFALGLAYVRPASPMEPAVGTSTSKDVTHLRNTLDDIAIFRGERFDALPVVVVESDADVTTLLRWHLREYTALELTQAWPADPDALVITAAEGNLPMPSNPENWQGMSFVALSTYEGPAPRCRQWIPPQCSEALRWYLYRTSPNATQTSNVILWQSETSAGW